METQAQATLTFDTKTMVIGVLTGIVIGLVGGAFLYGVSHQA